MQHSLDYDSVCDCSGVRERERLTSALDFLLKVNFKFGVWPGVALALNEVLARPGLGPNGMTIT